MNFRTLNPDVSKIRKIVIYYSTNYTILCNARMLKIKRPYLSKYLKTVEYLAIYLGFFIKTIIQLLGREYIKRALNFNVQNVSIFAYKLEFESNTWSLKITLRVY